MRKQAIGVLAAAGLAVSINTAEAVVVINEVFINPPTSGLDDTREFIELMGTPGKKLDGYGIAFVNGTEAKFYTLGSIPPVPSTRPEIDEFFSLDGLELGANGLLMIGIGQTFHYPTVLPDTNTRYDWGGALVGGKGMMWNGFRDDPGKLSNDGSNTVMLVRNRPGATQESHPTPPAVDLRWGKDVDVDYVLVTPVTDPQDGLDYDQFGDGNLDKGESDGLGGTNTDLKGAATLADIMDDLEVVDEVSYEHTRGWEYDVDGRNVDLGDGLGGNLPERRVHKLDDPNGINPDCLTRVDYRTKGDGWAPASGATGEMLNGNNWQDTATEQWIRGESVVTGSSFYFSNAANADPGAVQPYETHVPLWLDDGMGSDFDYTTVNWYQIMAGRINPLATAFIPGDSDRDGDADQDDIDKIAAVFGDDDWIFSNSFSASPEGDSGDPATQTRPWDADATGDNGIEACDLQWTLNFQGDTTGRVVGRTYDSTTPTPSGSGVHLNSNAGTTCDVTASFSLPMGRTLATLQVGDQITMTVAAEVTAGGNSTAGQENGVMQYVHDVVLGTGGVAQVVSVAADGSFSKTRASLESLQGASGDLGVNRVNGYTTSFVQGLSGASDMYTVTIDIIGEGTTSLGVQAASELKFAMSTPGGLTMGHTDNCGNPMAVAYPMVSLTATAPPVDCPGDANGDLMVNFDDLNEVLANWNTTVTPGTNGDVTDDGMVNFDDLNEVLANWNMNCS